MACSNCLCYLSGVDAENTRFYLPGPDFQVADAFISQCWSRESCCKVLLSPLGGSSGKGFHLSLKKGPFLPLNVCVRICPLPNSATRGYTWKLKLNHQNEMIFGREGKHPGPNNTALPEDKKPNWFYLAKSGLPFRLDHKRLLFKSL